MFKKLGESRKAFPSFFIFNCLRVALTHNAYRDNSTYSRLTVDNYILSQKYNYFIEKALRYCESCVIIINVRRTYKYGRQGARKEKQMKNMTNKQFDFILDMICEIIAKAENKEEAIKKIKELSKQ